MSIGIYDMDMSTYIIVPPNLEAMKLASYYKKNKEIVILTTSFNPDRHQKFFLRKDYDDGIYPKKMQTYKNLEYGGFAFTNNIYKPLPEEIEICKPDTSIYEKMETAFMNSGVGDRKKIFQNIINSEHGRISLDGKTIWPNYMKQFKYLPTSRNLMLHDFDLGAIDGGFEEVEYILSKARRDGWATKIGMKFPVNVYNGQDLQRWASLNPNRTFYSIRYNGIVDYDSWERYILQSRYTGVYINLEYNITGGGITEKELISSGLRRIFRQVILSRSRRIHFSLKYMDNFFSDSKWERVVDFFQFYLSSLTSEKAARYYKAMVNDTAFDFAKHIMEKPYKTYGEKAIGREEAREIFNFIRENNYPLFQDLYECNFKRLQEGENDWI